MVQVRQGIRYTKPSPNRTKCKLHVANIIPIDTTPSQEMHMKVEHIIKLYTGDTGHFPVSSKNVNQYIIIAYHCDSNVIISTPFKSRFNKYILLSYSAIMQRITDCNMMVDLQILDNEEITDYKGIIKSEWGVGSQLLPPHIHHRNSAERAIRTFKAHFLSTLAGIAPTFSKNLWDLIPSQTELTLNLLRQSKLDPNILAWEYLKGSFDYKATPLGPIGCPVMIHRKISNCKSWDFIGKYGWSIGVALDHYLCKQAIPQDTKAEKKFNTVEFRHQTITTAVVTPGYCILHEITTLTDALTDATTA